MGRWFRQTDTMIIMMLALGLFLFRFGNETWAAVSPRLLQAKDSFSAQYDRLTTALTTQADSAQTDEGPGTQPSVTPPVSTLTSTRFSGTRPQAYFVVSPGCELGQRYGCHY